MSLYLDASVLVGLFVIDPSADRAEAFLSAHRAIIVVSDFGAAEFSSAVARRVRMRDLTRAEGRLAFANFDDWIARSASRENVIAADIASADRILRRLDVNLRTPDALHIRHPPGVSGRCSSRSTAAWRPRPARSAWRSGTLDGVRPAQKQRYCLRSAPREAGAWSSRRPCWFETMLTAWSKPYRRTNSRIRRGADIIELGLDILWRNDWRQNR